MAHYEHLPIYKSALDLCIYFEKIVRHFDRHHKYVIGADLRRLSIKSVMLIIKANDARNKAPLLLQLKEALEEIKILVKICKEVKAFNSFKSFEVWKEKISIFLKQRLDLEINGKKTVIRPISNGIDYLGYIVRPFYILVRRRVINNLKQKIYSGALTRESYMSYLGHFKHANAYRLKQRIKAMINYEY